MCFKLLNPYFQWINNTFIKTIKHKYLKGIQLVISDVIPCLFWS